MIVKKAYYLVTKPSSPFFGQTLEYVGPSSLDNWGAIILRTSERGDSQVFRDGEFESVTHQN